MAAIGVKSPRAVGDLKATLQAQFEVILIESARSAAARCALACVSCIEEEREIYAKLCTDQVKCAADLDGRVASLEELKAQAQQSVSEPVRCGKGNSVRLADIAIETTANLSRASSTVASTVGTGSKGRASVAFAAAPSLKTQILSIQPEQLLRKVGLIRESLAKIDSDDAPSSLPRKSVASTLTTLVPQDFKKDVFNVDTQCILNVLTKIRESDDVKNGRPRNDSKFSEWREDPTIMRMASNLGSFLHEEAEESHSPHHSPDVNRTLLDPSGQQKLEKAVGQKTETIVKAEDKIKAGNAEIVVTPYMASPEQQSGVCFRDSRDSLYGVTRADSGFRWNCGQICQCTYVPD
jgi:hypothetical protein